jgi:signal transduction histidine kinase
MFMEETDMLLTRQQLEERLIALHQASLQLVEDISLETLLERIATVACKQAQAQYAALGVQGEDGNLKQFISVGMSPDQISRIPHLPIGRGLLGALMNTDQSIRIPDIHADPRSVGFPKNHPPMIPFLGVPILLGDTQLGQIYLTNKIGNAEFTADDEQIIQMLAAYAAVAIHNAHLYDDLNERDKALTRHNENLALLNNIAKVLTSSLKYAEILEKTLGLVMDYMDVEAGEIFLLDEDKQTLRLVLHHGQAAEAFWTRDHFKRNEGIIGAVAQSCEPAVSRDLAHDMSYLREAVVEAGFKQMACFPLTSSGSLVGVLSMVTRSAIPIENHDIQVITAIGSWAGLAIENARLHQDARRLAILEERERIAMDLHDGIIQSIYGVGLILEDARLLSQEDPAKSQERIQQGIDGLNQTIRDIRSYILGLHPRQFNNENLMDGLKRLLTEFRVNTLAEANLSGAPEDLADLPHAHAIALFHICQEALANAARHGAARKVDVSVWTTPERVVMEIKDDGKGFDMSGVKTTIGHGLSNMQTRIHQIGGEVEITSTTSEGTSILAWAPRAEKKEHKKA